MLGLLGPGLAGMVLGRRKLPRSREHDTAGRPSVDRLDILLLPGGEAGDSLAFAISPELLTFPTACGPSIGFLAGTRRPGEPDAAGDPGAGQALGRVRQREGPWARAIARAEPQSVRACL
jgi:hypothetical protein